MIELIVCIGIIMILIGLFLPALSKSAARTKEVRMAATVRDNAMVLQSYVSDNQDLYPLSGQHSPSTNWWRPLVASGHFASEAAVDPDGGALGDYKRVAMSFCMNVSPDLMVPGSTRPIDLTPFIWIRQAQVVYPASKGVLVQWVHVVGNSDVFWTWKSSGGPVSPIALVDGSVIQARCTDFRLPYPFRENWVGHPVLSTWEGVRGLDQLE